MRLLHEVFDRREAGDLDGALALVRRAYTEALPGEVAELMFVHGRLLLERMDLATAEKVLGALLQSTGDRALLLRAQTALGEVYRAQGRYAEAEEVFIWTITLAEAEWGPASLELAKALNGLGIASRHAGDYAAAEAAYRRALTVLESVAGPDHQDLAGLHRNLGGLAQASGDLVAAAEHVRRAVKVRARALGPDHPKVAADRAALAQIMAACPDDLDTAPRHDAVFIQSRPRALAWRLAP
ncbi:hypothetical protein GCM10010191_53230 [Actinomadura vinacea]|uniref:Tetratricopeptide repeat protein n=1 Tax=Actinomadura vinacea TaxID=115336 RepID=A0ABP5WP80_9ACTN